MAFLTYLRKRKSINITHIAIWVNNIESSKLFYCKYFSATHNKLYKNPKKDFCSYFISFPNGCRLELMSNISGKTIPIYKGGHFAISVGSKKEVNKLTETMQKDGVTIIGEPRKTGDGYYESIIADPDGNLVEITV